MRRERHNLSMLTDFTSSALNLTNTRCPLRTKSSGLAQLRKSESSQTGTQLSDFSQIPKILRARFRCMTSFTSHDHISYLGFLFWHLWMTPAWTPALMLHLTNPCAKRKVISLTKPKGKIYKTKSLGHYIT